MDAMRELQEMVAQMALQKAIFEGARKDFDNLVPTTFDEPRDCPGCGRSVTILIKRSAESGGPPLCVPCAMAMAATGAYISAVADVKEVVHQHVAETPEPMNGEMPEHIGAYL